MRNTTLLIIFFLTSIHSFGADYQWIKPVNDIDITYYQYIESTSAVLSAHDSLLAVYSTGFDNTVKIIDLSSNQMIFMQSLGYLNYLQVLDMKFSGDNKYLYMILKEGSYPYRFVEKWNIEDCAVEERYDFDTTWYLSGKLTPGLEYACVMDYYNVLHVWDYEAGEEIYRFEGTTWGYDFDFSPDAEYIIFTNQSGIQKVKFPEDSLIYEVSSPGNNYSKIKVTEDCKYIVQSHNDGAVVVFDYESCSILDTFYIPGNSVYTDYDSTNGHFLFSNVVQKQIHEREINNDNPLNVYEGKQCTFAEYCTKGDEKNILYGRRSYYEMDMESGAEKQIIIDSIMTRNLEFINDGSLVLAPQYYDEKAMIYNAIDGEFVRATKYPVHTYYPEKGVYAYLDEKSKDHNYTLYLIDFNSEEILSETQCGYCDINFSDDMQYFIKLDLQEFEYQLIDFGTGDTLRTFSSFAGISRDNKYILSKTDGFELSSLTGDKIYLTKAGLEEKNIIPKTFSLLNNSPSVAIIDENAELFIVDIETGDIQYRLPLGIEDIRGFKLSDNDSLIIFNNKVEVYVYDIYSGKELLKYDKFEEYVSTYYLSPDSKQMIIRYSNGTLVSLLIEENNTVKEEYISTGSLELFPNPATDKITINYTSEYKGNISIKIYSNLGNLIEELSSEKTCEEFNMDVDISGYSSGIYYYEIDCAGSRVRNGFVVSK